MNRTRLELILQIIDTGSLSAAAEVCHMSQPAASRNLKAMEEELGVELFARVGRGLELTAAGRAFERRARRIVDEMRAARRDVMEASNRGFYDLRIGTVDSIGTYVLPGPITELREAYPELGIKVFTSRTVDLMDRLGDDLDLVLVASSGPPTIGRPIRVGRYDLQFYGRKDTFADLAEVTTESEVTKFPIVQIAAQAGQPSLISEDLASFAETQSLSSVKAMIMSGFGVGALLSYMLTEAEREKLVQAQIEHDPNCGLYLIRVAQPAEARQETIATDLADVLEERLAE